MNNWGNFSSGQGQSLFFLCECSSCWEEFGRNVFHWSILVCHLQQPFSDRLVCVRVFICDDVLGLYVSFLRFIATFLQHGCHSVFVQTVWDNSCDSLNVTRKGKGMGMSLKKNIFGVGLKLCILIYTCRFGLVVYTNPKMERVGTSA